MMQPFEIDTETKTNAWFPTGSTKNLYQSPTKFKEKDPNSQTIISKIYSPEASDNEISGFPPNPENTTNALVQINR